LCLRTDEWKSLKKWSNKEFGFDNQPVTVEALLRCIQKETRLFISKV
jgi:hypothetical protein